MLRLIRLIGTTFLALLLIATPARAEEVFLEESQALQYCHNVNAKVEKPIDVKYRNPALTFSKVYLDKFLPNYTEVNTSFPKRFILFKTLRLYD